MIGYKIPKLQVVSTTEHAVSVPGNSPVDFTANAGGLSTDELYWITVAPTTDRLGFNDSCTDRKEQKLYSGEARVDFIVSLHACGVTTGNVEVKVYRVSWPADFTDNVVKVPGQVNTSWDFNVGSFSFGISASDTTTGFARQFRVTAVNASTLAKNSTGTTNDGTDSIGTRRQSGATEEPENSDPSEAIVLIDTPIIRADGNNAQASLEWTPIESILGTAYRGGTYSFRYSMFGVHVETIRNSDPSDSSEVVQGFAHTEFGWQPSTLGSFSSSAPIRNTVHTITGLNSEEIYAIQLIYTPSGAGLPARVYAGRYVYVYPSSSGPIDDDPNDEFAPRIATFPLEDRIGADRTYAYQICEDTFPVDKRAAWRNVIVHAFEQWELATDGLITMTYAGSQCADYSEVQTKAIEKIENETNTTLTAAQSRMVAAFIRGTDEFMSINPKDLELSEIMLIDDSLSPFDYFEAVAVSPGLAQVLGFTTCTFDKDKDDDEVAAGCAIHDDGYFTTDIFLNDNLDEQPHWLDFPDSNIWHSNSNVVHINSCKSGDVAKAYRVLVHEAGHALGVGGGKPITPYARAHPTIPFSVMNYDSHVYVESVSKHKNPIESDCAPYPFDIMAIYSLYQTAR